MVPMGSSVPHQEFSRCFSYGLLQQRLEGKGVAQASPDGLAFLRDLRVYFELFGKASQHRNAQGCAELQAIPIWTGRKVAELDDKTVTMPNKAQGFIK